MMLLLALAELILILASASIQAAPGKSFKFNNNTNLLTKIFAPAIPQQWPYYEDPLRPAVAPQEPNYYDYWNGNIFPDCCVIQCSIECYPRVDPIPIETCSFRIPGWNDVLGKRVYLGSKETDLTWFAAEAKAIEAGGHLLEIRSSSDNLILGKIKPCYDSSTHVWIGGNQIAENGTWVWSSQGRPISGYTNFQESDTIQGRCLDIRLSDVNYKWHKSSCSASSASGQSTAPHAFIAQLPELEPATRPTLVPTSPTTVRTTNRPTPKPTYGTSTTTEEIYIPTPS